MSKHNSSRPCIAIDARYVRERPSGIGAMVEQLITRVPGLMPDVDFVFLTHPRAKSPITTFQNVREVVVEAEANGPATLFFLPQVFDFSKVDLFHATFNTLPRAMPTKSVVTIHDMMWMTHPRLCRSSGPWGDVETWFYRAGITSALNQAERIIAISNATRDAIAGVDADAGRRTVVIGHGVQSIFSPAKSADEKEEARRFGLGFAPGASRFVLTVGQAAGYKNHENNVRAFCRAFAADPTTHLLLVQRLGSTADTLLQIAREERCDGKVHVLPTLPHGKLSTLYRGAFCLLHASLLEGWGMPVTEAMASGCPVVTSVTSSLPEVTGGHAVLVDPESTTSIEHGLRRLALSESLQNELSATGPKWTARFSWDNQAAKIATVYRELIALFEYHQALVLRLSVGGFYLCFGTISSSGNRLISCIFKFWRYD